MKYLLTFYGHEGVEPTPEEMKEGMELWNAFENEAVDAGVLIACEPLEGSETATTIRIPEDGEATPTDGPFAESKEQLGGFCLLECKDREEALEWAAKVPLRPRAGLEVRAVRDLSPFGRKSPTASPVKAHATA
ncbi:MAG: YciI family protein [Solirubrobacterales bacterium]